MEFISPTRSNRRRSSFGLSSPALRVPSSKFKFSIDEEFQRDDEEISVKENQTAKQSSLGLQNEARLWDLSDFEIGKPLGRGKFGNVYMAKEKASGVVVAVKVVSLASMNAENAELYVRREIELQSRLKHPSIIRLFGFFSNIKSCFLCLEFAPSGEVLPLIVFL